MTKINSLSASIIDFDPDQYPQTAVALQLKVEHHHIEQPMHQHKKGQLLITLKGNLTCTTTNSIWLAPPHHAIWLPSGVSHSNQATDNAQIYFLFIDADYVNLPEQCCTLEISPLIRELIKHMALQDQNYSDSSPMSRIALVLLEQLSFAPVKQLCLPITEHAKIKYIAHQLIQDPANRFTLTEWAEKLAMTDRTLARLIKNETGLTFGRWRQQFQLLIALSQLSQDFTVQQVAGNLGYDSVNAFITMFKKALGCTPTQFFSTFKS